MALANLFSISTGALYAAPILLAIQDQSWKPLIGAAGLLSTLGMGEGIKHLVIGNASVRPHGARDCDAWAKNGNCEGQPGMPSTHAAFATFFAVFYFSQVGIIGRIALILYVILVIWSRLYKRCHTIGQVLVGTAFGIGMGMLFRMIARKL